MNFLKWKNIPLSDQDASTSKQAEAAHTDVASATTQSFNKNRWRGKKRQNESSTKSNTSPNKYPHIKIIDPIDDNVFVDEYRVEEICKGLIERKLAFNGEQTADSIT